MIWRRALAAALAVAAMAPAAGRGSEPARRIVSINLCTDQLVLMLAARERIASVSYLAADPRLSPVTNSLDGIPLNHGFVEEALRLKPDLVLAGLYGQGPTVEMLRRFGIRVEQVGSATTIAGIRAAVRRVAGLVGAQAAGERLLDAFDRRLAAIKDRRSLGPRPLAAILYGNGTTSGAGTLPNAALSAAGFDNLAARMGITGDGTLPLERLLRNQPDLIVTGLADAAPPAKALSLLHHRALTRGLAETPRLALLRRDWICGTPHILAAIDRLAAARRRIASLRRAEAAPAARAEH